MDRDRGRSRPDPARRARRSFWVLTAIAVTATGSLSAALTAPPGPLTALRFAASAGVVLTALALMVRIMRALARPRAGGAKDRRRP